MQRSLSILYMLNKINTTLLSLGWAMEGEKPLTTSHHSELRGPWHLKYLIPPSECTTSPAQTWSNLSCLHYWWCQRGSILSYFLAHNQSNTLSECVTHHHLSPTLSLLFSFPFLFPPFLFLSFTSLLDPNDSDYHSLPLHWENVMLKIKLIKYSTPCPKVIRGQVSLLC